MNTELDLNTDIIDVSEVTDRVDELRDELQTAMDENAEGHNLTTLAEYVAAVYADASPAHAHEMHPQAEELLTLEKLLDELRGNGGDHQWEGDWYPSHLIRDSYMESYLDDLIEDIGDLPRNLPSYLRVTVDYDALKMDYTTVDVGNDTYWYR